MSEIDLSIDFLEDKDFADVPPYEDIVKDLLEQNDFCQVDDSLWTQSFHTGEEVYVQKCDNYWEVYFKNKQHQFSDEEMIEGLEIMKTGE